MADEKANEPPHGAASPPEQVGDKQGSASGQDPSQVQDWDAPTTNDGPRSNPLLPLSPVASSGGTPPDPPTGFIPQQLFEARLKAHDFVQEHLKQVIFIASAVIAVTVTFLKDIVGTKGDQLHLTWLLPVFWILVGLSVLVAVYSIAIHVNTLDQPNKKHPASSFAAGDNDNSRTGVMAIIFLFGGGMLILGIFAAINYKVFINRGGSEYKISSAYQAVEEARKQIDPSLKIMSLTKVELTKGVDESLAGTPTWNVEFEVKKPSLATEEIKTERTSMVCHRCCQQRCCCDAKPEEPAHAKFNCLLDARSGRLLTIIESDQVSK